MYPLIRLQDFVECGLVYQCLRQNPDISDSEIARQTRLLLDRVAFLRSIAEKDLGLHRKVQPKPADTARLKNEDTKENSEGEKAGYPLQLNAEYIGRINGINQNGSGVTLIKGVSCIVPGTALGELVKFRTHKIEGGCYKGELIRVLQKCLVTQSAESTKSTIQESIETEVQGITKLNTAEEKTETRFTCISCHSPIKEKDLDAHDGLCTHCYYSRLQNEAAKTERRSGTYGADRAGTW